MKLSIIIPCYNCEKTLREAVNSCYTQGLSNDEFEIIMVDDGSTDNTPALMRQLTAEHSNINFFYHAENRGGGAARNTGILNAQGELIYCLDSDNLFAPDSVKKLINFLEQEKVDGVAFYERRFFYGKNINQYNTHINTITNRSIKIDDIFIEKNNILLDNFLYTKKSYLRTIGYPEHHGFDTQCFELRYLSSGNIVKVCPESIFYHRQGMQDFSYFERVHNSGMFSINYMLIFEDIFHLFTPKLQKQLIEFQIFTHNKSYESNIFSFLKNKVKSKEQIFIESLEDYLVINGQKKWLGNKEVSNPYKSLIYAINELNNQNYKNANIYLSEHISTTKILSPYIQFLSLRILHGLANKKYSHLVKDTLANLNTMQIAKTKKSTILSSLSRRNQLIYSSVQYVKGIFK